MKAGYRALIFSLAVAGIIINTAKMVRANRICSRAIKGRGLQGLGDEGKDVVKLDARVTPPAGKQPAMLFITAQIKQGWHIYSITQEPGGPIRTKIDLAQSPQYRLAGEFQSQPPPKKEKDPDAFGDLVIESHYDSVTWVAPLELAPGIDPAKLRINGKVNVQMCDASSCLPPRDFTFSALQGQGIAMPSDKMAFSLWIKLGSAFLGGLILNLMPCVLPVISLKIFSFLQQAGEHRSRVFVLNFWYSVGLLAVFMVLAALAATAGLAWGEQFTLPWFKVAMTALVFIMAISFLGVWEIPIPGFVGTGKAGEIQAREGPGGAFFKGAFATILATPCSGPFLGPVFGYLLQEPPYMAYLIFGRRWAGHGFALPGDRRLFPS